MKQSMRPAVARALASLPRGKALLCALILAASMVPASALADTEETNALDMDDVAAPSIEPTADVTYDNVDALPSDNLDEPGAILPSDSNASNPGDAETPTYSDVSPSDTSNNGQLGATGTTAGALELTVTQTPETPSTAAEEQPQTTEDEAGIEAYATSGTTFSDVSSNDWYAPYVSWASNQGLINGYKDSKGNLTGRFGPENSLTRAEFAAMLWRNAGCPRAASAGFSDTGKHWAKKAIDWCASKGIVTGYGGTNSFGPDDRITREQLCTMLWRNAGCPSGGVSPSRWHDGSSVDSYAWNAVSWAAGAGIMAGTASAPVSLNPQANATRAEAAKMLAVALGGYEGTSPEHQAMQSLTGWWKGISSIGSYYYIHDGKIDCYTPVSTDDHRVILGYKYYNTVTFTSNDIKWYKAGTFNKGRSKACYAFQYNGGSWRFYESETEGMLYCWWGTPNYGTYVTHHSMSDSWQRAESAPTIL